MRAAANGIEIEYRFDGPADAPVVVLSHSLATTMAMWEPQLDALTGRYRVLRYDMRGHGASSAPAGPYSSSLLASDVAGLLDRLELKRVHFVGLSIGGMIGQRLAIDHASRLASVALCSTTSQITDAMRGIWDQRIAAVEAGGMASQVATTLERWFTAPYRAAHPDKAEWIGAMIRDTPVAGFIGCGRAIQNLDVGDGISAIRLPTLVMPGELDPAMPPAVSEVIHRAVPGSEFAVVANASHLANIEQPASFNERLLRFLDKQR